MFKLITNQFYLIQNSSLRSPHTNEDAVLTSGNNAGSLQLTLPSVVTSESIVNNSQMMKID